MRKETHELVPVELAQVDDGDGALRGLDLGSLERDELQRDGKNDQLRSLTDEQLFFRLTLSRLMVGRKEWAGKTW